MIFSYLDDQFEAIGNVVGLPDDQLKVVFSWIFCIPFGFFQKKLTNPFVRNIYGLALGLFLQYLCIKEYTYLMVFQALVVYAMAKILKKKCDWPSFFFLYSILIAYHIHRFFDDYYGWRIGHHTVLMMILCKMTYFTFDYCDGKTEIPPLLEYLGYVFFYPSACIGPVFKIQTYIKFIYLKDQYANIPSSVKPCFQQFFYGTIYLVILQLFGPYFSPQHIFQQEWYQELNFILKQVVWHPIIVFVQIRYLGAWKFAQAGIHACGISYEGGKDKNGNDNFDHIITVQDSFLIEYLPMKIVAKWNRSVQNWLKDVFHARFSKMFKPQQAILLVFTVSALWHGVHPMYFISFIHFALYNDCAKFLYKAKDKFEWIPKPLRTIFCWAAGKGCVNYFGLGFNLLEMSVIHQVYSSVYYCFTIIPLIMYIFFSVTGYGQKKKSIVDQKEKQKFKETKQE
ncbi:hypothetical protein PPERSA_11477 [Pseudocohnilembus persalinus]|uniref:Membrane bound O-acyl transferase, MBOAT n=1 Tax=Pseudocohnilembus persalinus TaxID=266149 RepID=A0A0V0QXR3_PSEPJ|nr:hypothetical protein PPERSA_11477 [Pseudocohnilembus persalinus]|eukprot:KRX06832.1 hypothetical protein PPERSA_11477 [Pseudocohnilembus persalinus]